MISFLNSCQWGHVNNLNLQFNCFFFHETAIVNFQRQMHFVVIPAIESSPSDLSSECVTPDERKKKETMELMECTHNMFKIEESKDSESEKVWCESIRKEDQRKDVDSKRKEHQAKLQEHSDLLDKIERPHNKLLAFPTDGNKFCKKMLSETFDGCLERATALSSDSLLPSILLLVLCNFVLWSATCSPVNLTLDVQFQS